MSIKQAAKDLLPDIIRWRRELHQIPELEKELYKTQAYLQRELDGMGIPYTTMAKTGLCAVIQGKGPGKTIALRADMDALLIKEDTGLPFASTGDCMHACGHDAHMAMVLAAAKLLRQGDFHGCVKLFFQTEEEKNSGAKEMVREGCLENPKVDVALALHVGDIFPEVGLGQIGIRRGPAMAAVDQIYVTVNGVGGHGAKPEGSRDPVLCACHMVTSLYQIISRELGATTPAVLSIGAIHGGDLFNIIPSQVTFCGTARTTTPEDRAYLESRVKEICRGVAQAGRCQVEVDYVHGHPALINDETVTDWLEEIARRVVGRDNVVDLKKPSMVAEDMSYFFQEVPGTYFFLGTQNPDKGITYPVHHARFNLDEEVLYLGTAVFVEAVLDFLL